LLIIIHYTDAKTLDMILMGESIPSGQAKKFGLVDHDVSTKDKMLLGLAKK
jgi:enoyl-CoA hydratase/carnithine racemase